MQNQSFPCYGTIQGTILIIGYGSIGQGMLPIIKRHFNYDRIAIIDPVEEGPNDPNIKFEKVALTQENYKSILDRIFGDGKGFCVNVSVQTSSKDILIYCQSKGILYLDTVVEEWAGFYANS
jgi:homospermidine synthase